MAGSWELGQEDAWTEGESQHGVGRAQEAAGGEA